MHELVAEPGKLLWIKGFDKPINHATHAWDPDRVRMIGQPDVKLEMKTDVDRYNATADSSGISRQQSYSSALGDRPEVSAAHIGSQHDVLLRCARVGPFE